MNNPSSYGYVNEMDRASDNYSPSLQNTAQQSFRLGEIAEQNAQARSDALYGWSTGNDGFGFKGNGGAALRYGGVRASGDSENGLYLSDAAENRLISGQTVTDFGDPYAGGGNGPTADPVGALRRFGNALPNVKSGFLTDNFVNKALNSDVPVLQRQLYGATLPLVAVEQMGIGLINAPGRIISAIDNAGGMFTEPTTEGKVTSFLTMVRDGAEGALGLMPLIPAGRLTAPMGSSRSAGAALEADIAGTANSTGPGTRPTWRQSELDVGAQLEGQGYRDQVSFKNGVEVPYGTKGSTRPDYYGNAASVEVKNYN